MRLSCAVLTIGALAGCAGESSAPPDEHTAGPITTSPHSETDSPPATVSGYVDSSYTVQPR